MNITEYYRLQLNAITGKDYEFTGTTERFLKCDGHIIAESVDKSSLTMLLRHMCDLANELIETPVVTPSYRA